MSIASLFVLATPLFGLSLTPELPLPSPPGSLLQLPIMMQVGGDDAAPAEQPPAEAEPPPETHEATPLPAVQPEPEPAHTGPTQTNGAAAAEMRAYADQLRQRQEIAGIHRIFGIATWASMLVTEVLGMFQYINVFGYPGASRESTPCVAGGAIFGQDQCWGIPWVHRVAAMTTTALYGTAFTLSFMMPDPDNAESGNSTFAEHLRIHKTLRWVHLAGMIAQILLGFAIGENWFGLDRANNFDALQVLATVHEVIGLGTFGVLTAAGALMVF